MSKFLEASSAELVALSQRAHEELAQLESRLSAALDHGQEALELRAAIERHRIMIREIGRALRTALPPL